MQNMNNLTTFLNETIFTKNSLKIPKGNQKL